MRQVIAATVIALGLGGMISPQAHAIGCLSGGVAGALAGHMAGHGVLGAVGGCVAGHAWQKHQLRQQDVQDQNNYVQRRRSYDPNYQNPWQQ